MPPVSVLIKPASSACNMNCEYCFYKDVAANRENAFTGMMTEETAQTLIRRAFDFADGSCSFMFQGGEPTLAGLDFFEKFIETEKKYAKKGLQIFHSIQTNGYTVDDSWAEYFRKNRFLVGLSLDGPAEIHNRSRRDNAGENTFNRMMKSASLLEKHGVDFNILSVVTGKNAKQTEKIYNFFKKSGFRYLQFIPCLDPLNAEHGSTVYSLSAQEYGDFLIRSFRLWYNDFRQGNYISIRHIDNYIRMIAGMPPESCNMNGRCGIQFVTEADGTVYPCDFYVLDDKQIGNIFDDSFEEMIGSPTAQKFITESLNIPDECKKCRFRNLCRNGCKRDRMMTDGQYDKNIYCASYKRFFTECGNELLNAAKIIYRR